MQRDPAQTLHSTSIPVPQYGTGTGKEMSLRRIRNTCKHSSRSCLRSFTEAKNGYVQHTKTVPAISGSRHVKRLEKFRRPLSSRTPPGKELKHLDSAEGTIICEHFDACSGCSMATGVLRPAQYLQAAQFFGSLGLSHFPLIFGLTMGWRCRAKLAVRGEAGRPIIGLFQEGSHDVTAIPNCSIHHPRINQAVALIEQVMRRQGTVPYEEATGHGQLRYIQLTAVSSDLDHHSTPAEDDPGALVQVVLVWNAADAASPKASQGRSLAQLLWQEAGFGSNHDVDQRRNGTHSPLLHSVVLNYQAASCNTVFGSSWEHVAGPETVWQRWQGTPVSIGPGSFVQANFGAFQSALAAIADAVPSQAKHVVELHAGVGAIGLSLLGKSSSSDPGPHPWLPGQDHPKPSKSVQSHSKPGPSKEPFPCLRSLRCVEINPNGEPLFKASVARLLANWGKRQSSCNPVRSQQSVQGRPHQLHGSPHRLQGKHEPHNQEPLQPCTPSRAQLQQPSPNPSSPSLLPPNCTKAITESQTHLPKPQEGRHSHFKVSSVASAPQPEESKDWEFGPECCPVPERVEYVVAAAGSRPGAFLQGADVVIVDPPRKGLELPLLEALRRCDWPRASTAPVPSQQQPHGTHTNAAVAAPPTPEQYPPHTVSSAMPPRRLIYLSCGYPALVRDTRVLLGLQAAPQQGIAAPSTLGKTQGSSVEKKGGAAAKAGDWAGVGLEGGEEEDLGSEGVNSRSMSKSSKRRRRRQRRRVSSTQQMKAEVPESVESGEEKTGGGSVARWKLVNAKAFLFFPGTDSIETLAVFEEAFT